MKIVLSPRSKPAHQSSGYLHFAPFFKAPLPRLSLPSLPGATGRSCGLAGIAPGGREGEHFSFLPLPPPPPFFSFFFSGASAPSPGFPRPSEAHPRRAAFHLKRRKKSCGSSAEGEGAPGPFSGSPHPGPPWREAAGGRSGNAEPRSLRAPRRENRPRSPPHANTPRERGGGGWSAVPVKTLATHG